MSKLRALSRVQIAVLLAVGIAAGAGVTAVVASGGDTGQPAANTASHDSPGQSQPTTRPSTTTTTLAKSPYYSGPIAFTTSEGWQYSFTPNIGRIIVTLSKNVQTSSPGKAKLQFSGDSSAGVAFPGSVTGTTPGRTTPTATIYGAVSVWWPISPDVQAQLPAIHQHELVGEQACAVGGNPPRFNCVALGIGNNTPRTFAGRDDDESYIDQLLRISPTASPPYVSVNIYNDGQGFTAARIQTITFAPDGTYQLSA